MTSITCVEAPPYELDTFTVPTKPILPDSRVAERLRPQTGTRLLQTPLGLHRKTPPSQHQNKKIPLTRCLSSDIFTEISRICEKNPFTSKHPSSNYPSSALHVSLALRILFTTIGHASRETDIESLEIHVWRDSSVLKVSVTERTMIRHANICGVNTVRLNLFAEECICVRVLTPQHG